MKKRARWSRVWEAQQREDAGEAPLSSRDALSTGVPPRYAPSDFRDVGYFQLRGKLDVPRERFILYPGAGADGRDRFGWAGWSCHERAAALLRQHHALQTATEDPTRVVPILSGFLELIPWIERWEAVQGARGDPPASALRSFVEAEAQRLDLSVPDVHAWRPARAASPRTSRQRHRQEASSR